MTRKRVLKRRQAAPGGDAPRETVADRDAEASARQAAIRLAKHRMPRLREAAHGPALGKLFGPAFGPAFRHVRRSAPPLPAAHEANASPKPSTQAAARQPGSGPLRAPPSSKNSRTVFVSYARDDRAAAAALVEHLRRSGVDAHWDQDFIAGRRFDEQIEEAIATAGAVIVLWSQASAKSPYVRDEAKLALDGNKLVATHVADFDFTRPPLGFGSIHAIPVTDEEKLWAALARRGVVASRS